MPTGEALGETALRNCKMRRGFCRLQRKPLQNANGGGASDFGLGSEQRHRRSILRAMIIECANDDESRVPARRLWIANAAMACRYTATSTLTRLRSRTTTTGATTGTLKAPQAA